MNEAELLEIVVDEYRGLVHQSRSDTSRGRNPDAGIIQDLVASADWSNDAARELVQLANQYGVFMLRNALALAMAMGKEDGTRRF